MVNALEQVCWSEDSNINGATNYSTSSPFESRDEISITSFNNPITLFSQEITPEEYDNLRSPILVENGNWWTLANTVQKDIDTHFEKLKKGSVVADAKLSFNYFIGEDWPSHSELQRAYFKDGEIVAVSGHKDKGFKRPDLSLNRIDLNKIFVNGVGVFAYNTGYTKTEAFYKLQTLLTAESPNGQGLHNSYREAIAGVLPKNFKDERYRIEAEGPD